MLEELAEVARGCRIDLAADVEQHLGPFAPLHLRALLEVPRERFVRLREIGRSADDTPLPLDDEGYATISAPHAYLLSFRLLELGPGDRLLELGAGSGYGAALASSIVGDEGQVVSVEIDARLFDWARSRLQDRANVRVLHGDAAHLAEMPFFRPNKVSATFAVDRIPTAWTAMLPDGGRLAVPVGPSDRDLAARVGEAGEGAAHCDGPRRGEVRPEPLSRTVILTRGLRSRRVRRAIPVAPPHP